MGLLMSSGRFNLTEFSGEVRYIVESLSPDDYRRLGYYDRWAVAIKELYSRLPADLAPGGEQSVPTRSELDGVRAGSERVFHQDSRPPLDVGTTVVVELEPPPGHNRLPVYVRGHRGVIRSIYSPQEVPGCRSDPVEFAYVYNVAFTTDELWADGSADELRFDLWAHYITAEKDAGNGSP